VERGWGDQEEPAAPDLGPLPGGHHGLSREQVSESQRERLLAAIAQDVATRGYRGSTITEIVKIASVSTRDFYEHFESKEECFLAAFEAVLGHVEGLVSAGAAEHPGDWPQQVIAALTSTLRFFSERPDLARLCLVEPVAATATIAVRFRDAVLSCVPLLAVGRKLQANGQPLPESTEDSLIGGVVSLASRSILLDEADSLEGLLPDMVEFVLSPYLGAEMAKELASGSTE
jgi:AcrR family transcriptional regulator